MPRNKQSLAKRAVTLALALCMVFTTAAQSLGAIAYADSTSTAISSSTLFELCSAMKVRFRS